MKFVFECDDCKKQYHSWERVRKHLISNPDHAPAGYGLVNVFLASELDW